jgi:hypothetical protein
MGIPKLETDIYIGFSQALHFQCRNIFVKHFEKKQKTFASNKTPMEH